MTWIKRTARRCAIVTRRGKSTRAEDCGQFEQSAAKIFTLEYVPKKLIDFFDQNMLQLFEFERFLPDQMIPSDREAL